MSEIVSNSLAEARSYWSSQLSGQINDINFMSDYTGTKKREEKNETIKFSDEQYRRLMKICKNDDMTLFVFLFSVMKVALYKTTGSSDLYMAAPLLNNQNGEYDNCIIIRNQIEADETFKDLLIKVRKSVIDGYKYGAYPIKRMINGLNLDKSISPFKFFFMLDTIHDKNKIASFCEEFENEFIFCLKKSPEGLELEITYNAYLFNATTIRSYLQRFLMVTAQILEAPGKKVKEYKIITEDEEMEILSNFNNTEAPYPKDKTVPELFEEKVKAFGEKQAVYHNGQSLTYAQLNTKADRLAAVLIEKGVQRGEIIGIMSRTSLEMVIGLLAILKVGGIYLPLDPDYPVNRTKYMLEDSQVKTILIQDSLIHKIEQLGYQNALISLQNVLSEEEGHTPAEAVMKMGEAEDVAYVLYTSGSTGQPKGVMIEHRNIARLVMGTDFIDLNPTDNLLMTGSFVFDITTFEIWAALLNGLTLFLIDQHVLLDPFQLGDFIKEHRIDILHLIPQLFNQVAVSNASVFESLKYFLVGGDLVRPKYVNEIRKKFRDLKILHMYGPTENTTFSSFMPVEAEYPTTIPIGKPMNNSTIYIFNEWGQLQPIGVPGEVCVGGGGIARGYLNKPEMTQEKFIKNPYKPEEIIYKTGDQGRWLPEGIIEFLGRKDQQVKIRGSRLEISEIEARLSQYEGVKEAIVVAKESGSGQEEEKRLYAYIVSENKMDVGALREHLAADLSSFMIPSVFIQIPNIPLTPNGKVDYKALAAIEADTEKEYTPPEDELEEKLVDIWSQILVLPQNRIDVHSDFFELGGHSLKAMTLGLKLYQELNIQIPITEFFKNPTIKELADYIKSRQKDTYADIPKAEEKDWYPLSSAQTRLYILQNMDPKSTSYNMTEVYQIEGEIDRNKLESAFHKLINRHESLRTTFVMQYSDIVQKITDETAFNIEYSENNQRENTEIIHEFIRPFDLSKAPLLRVGLIKIESNKHILILDMHHIISDGFSSGILIKDFLSLYTDSEPTPLKRTYKDYAEWQLKQKSDKKLEAQKQYWQEVFKDGVPILNLNTDYLRPDVQSFEGDRIRFALESDTVQKLNRLALEENATSFMMLMSFYFILISKLTGQKDIVIGTTTSGRTHPDLRDMTGMFVNTLPIRGDINKNETFIDLLKKVKENVLKAMENQDYQFEDMIEDLNVDRSTDRNPMFDIMFTFENADTENFDIPGVKLQKYDYKRRTSKFDLTLFGTEGDEGISFELEYGTRLFKQSTIERYGAFFKKIISDIVQNPNMSIGDIDLISVGDKDRFLYDYNDTYQSYSKDKTVQALFDACAEKMPENTALIFNNKAVTYRELKELSDKLAVRLRQHGIVKGDIVGLLMDNSIELIVGILGILKAEAAYLPIDPDFPEERKKFMLKDCDCKLLLTKSTIKAESLTGIKRVNADDSEIYEAKAEPFKYTSSPEDMIYIIYTSGSTGTPKGCAIKQKGAVNYIEWAVKQYFDEGPIYFPFYTSAAYDLTVTSIFTPLLSGKTVVIYPKGIEAIHLILNDGLSNIMKATPTHLRLMLELDCSASVMKRIIVGGEQLTSELANKIYNKFDGRVELINEYGPTETVVGCMIHRFNPKKDKRSAVPIGIPASNMQVYVLNEDLNICPVGVIGEMYIGGVGVSPGYINRPELTESVFIKNPFNDNPTARLYKTGDLAFYLEEGLIEYVGRKDSQIKIRGYRVEIEEIERCLLKYPGIKNAAVLAKEGRLEDKFLCAYFVAETDISIPELKNFLTQSLPDYMIPAYFIKVDALSVSTGGKLDLRGLPEPQSASGAEVRMPEGEIEKYLYDIWSKNLNTANFGIHDNFFDIGGNSLLLMGIHAQISPKYPDIKITDFFKYTTIQSLSQYILSCGTKSELAELDLTIKPHDVYLEGGGSQKEAQFAFDLPQDTVLKIKGMAQSLGITLTDIFVGLYAFVLSEMSEDKTIKVQTAVGGRADHVVSLTIDLDENEQMDRLFAYVHETLHGHRESVSYQLKDLDPVTIKKQAKAIIPFIGESKYLTSSVDLARLYDIILEIDEKGSDSFAFTYRYNQGLLNPTKMEELIYLYTGLLENIAL